MDSRCRSRWCISKCYLPWCIVFRMLVEQSPSCFVLSGYNCNVFAVDGDPNRCRLVVLRTRVYYEYDNARQRMQESHATIGIPTKSVKDPCYTRDKKHENEKYNRVIIRTVVALHQPNLQWSGSPDHVELSILRRASPSLRCRASHRTC